MNSLATASALMRGFGVIACLAVCMGLLVANSLCVNVRDQEGE